VTYNDGGAPVTLTGIGDGYKITVAPASTKTYTITSVESTGGGITCSGIISGPFATVTVNPLPATSEIFADDVDLCNDDTNKKFWLTNHGSLYSYEWTIPASILDPVLVDNHYFIFVDAKSGTSGTGTITAKETIIATGCSVTKTIDVSVAPVIAGENITGPDLLCIGDEETYSVTTPRGTSDYVWTLPAGASITSGDPSSPVITVKFSMAVEPGTIRVVETTAEGCQVIHNPRTINVKQLPSIYNVSAPSFYCYGTGGVNVTLSNSQPGVNYQLYRDGSPEGAPVAGGGSSLTWPGMPSGTYTVNATSTAAPFCNIMMNGSVIVEENPEIIISSVTISNPACAGANNGSIIIGASGGFPPAATLQYSINGGITFQSSNSFTNVGPGTYNVVVKDARNCTSTYAPVAVTEPAALTISSLAVSSPIKCFGDTDGKAKVIPAGGTPVYTYAWYYDASLTSAIPGMISDEATDLSAGTYYVKVTDDNGCTVSGNVTLTQPSQLTASAAVTSNYNGSKISCNGADDAVISVTATGGTGIKHYVLIEDAANVTGFTSGTFTGVGPGSYTVRVTDENLCEKITAAVSVTEPLALSAIAAISSNYNGSHISCNGGSDGKITVTAAGGTGALSYIINEAPLNTTGAISGVFSGLASGPYTITVTDLNICSITTLPVTLNDPPVLTIASSITSNYNGSEVSCNGAADGKITATSAGGTGTRTYQIVELPSNTTGAVSGIFTGLPAGTYTLKVSDANGCSATSAALTVDNPPAVTASIAITSNYNGSRISCYGASDGEIKVTASGGTGALNYVLNQDPGNTSGSTTGEFTGLTAGVYSVTVTDENGCSKITATVTLNNPPAINASAAVTSSYHGAQVSCSGASDGIITITASGGTGDLRYVLNEMPANVTGFTSGIFTGVPAGTYTVNVTDLNSCPKTTVPVTIRAPSAITGSAIVSSSYNGSHLSCNGASDGRLTVTAFGGTGTLGYLLVEMPGNLTGAASGIFTGVPAGAYTVKITDENGCNFTTPSVNVVAPSPVTASASVTSNYNGSQISCNGAADAVLKVTASGGTGALAYSITELPGNITGAATGIFTGVGPGTFNIRVTDANGCTGDAAPVMVSQPSPLTISGAVSSNYNGSHISCYGESDGEITVTSSGGTGALTYVLNQDPANITGAASGIFTGLSAGTYTVTVRDANLCSKTTTAIVLSNPALLNATAAVTSNYNGSQISCNGADDAVISVIVSGGTGTLSYLLVEDPGNSSGAASGIFTGVGPGSYTVRVRDLNLCEKITPAVIVSEPAVLTASASISSNYNGAHLSCNMATDGKITVAASGGTGSYSYVLNEIPGNLTGATTGIFTGLPAGPYTVNVKDLNNCSIATLPVTLIAPPTLAVTLDGKTDVSCYANATGNINVTVSGGVMPSGGYFYTWTGNNYLGVPYSGNIEDITDLKAGTYNLTVRDANGCTVTLAPVTLDQPDALSVTLTGKSDVLCYDASTGSIDLNVSGGTGPYNFTWSGTDYLGTAYSNTTEDLAGLKAGTYNLTVTDAGPCSVTLATVTITQPTELTVSLASKTDVACFGNSTGAVFVNVSGGTKPVTGYVFEWTGTDYLGASFISALQNISGLKAGNYSLKVTDQNGCFVNLPVVTISQPDVLTPGSIGSAQVLCFGSDPAELTESTAATGGPEPYNYQWQSSYAAAGPFSNIPGAQNMNYTPLANPAATLYYRRAVTSGTCPPVFSNVVEVRVNPVPVARLTGGATICSGETTKLRVEMTAGTGPFDIDIQNYGTITGYVSGADIDVSPAFTTTYTITSVEDANGCAVSAPSANLTGSATVKVRISPAITLSPVSTPICEYGATSFTADATGDDIIWQWYVNKGTAWEVLPEANPHYGTTTRTLNIFGGTRVLNGYKYRAVATGCGTSAISGEATLIVNTSPSIEIQPVDQSVCAGGSTTFRVTSSGSSPQYQWQVNTITGFTDLTNTGIYSGVNSNILQLTGITGAYDNSVYRVRVSGACPSPVYSNFVNLKVGVPPVVTLNPTPKSICAGSGTEYFTANGTGIIEEMRWQVNNAGTWTDLTDDAVYSGTGTPRLSFINPPAALNGKEYRLALKSSCVTVYTTGAVLTVNSNPVISFASNPMNICGGTEVTMNPVITGGSGTWTQHTWTGSVGPLNNYTIKSPLFKTTMPGAYDLTYTVRDDKGCTGSGSVTVNVDSPDATFTKDKQSGCTPLTVSFSKDMTGIASWSWDFGDGSPANTTEASPSHQFVNTSASALQYRTVTLTVNSAGGCSATSTSVVTVYPGINATFTADKITVCSGGQITFTGATGAGTYNWDFGDGVTGPGSYTANHTFFNTESTALTRTVTLTTSSFYSCNDTKTLTVTILPKPVPDFAASPVMQVYNPAGNQVTFTNMTNEGAWTWSWTFGDGSASSVKNPTHTYSDMGSFDVWLEVSNGTCSEKIKHQVNVVPLAPEADFDSIPSGCEPLKISAVNTSLNTGLSGTTYKWEFGDGAVSYAKNPEYLYSDPGSYRITLTVTGPGGTSTKSQVVHVYATPAALFDVTPKEVYVNDQPVRAFNLSQGADYFVWEWGDGDTSRIEEPFHKYMKSGVYPVSLSAFRDNGNGNICFDKYTLTPGITVTPAGELRFASVFRPNTSGEIDGPPPIGGEDIDKFFFPPLSEKISEYKLQIFNRLGVLIFETHDINKPWNGYYRGRLCPQGVYVWFVEGKYTNGQVYKKVGDITLLH
jgi:PKD repeat protein